MISGRALVALAAAAAGLPEAITARRLSAGDAVKIEAAPLTAHAPFQLERALSLAQLLELRRCAIAAAKPPAGADPARAAQPALTDPTESKRPTPATAAAKTAQTPPAAHCPHTQLLVDARHFPALASEIPSASTEGDNSTPKKTGPASVNSPGPRNPELEVPWSRLNLRAFTVVCPPLH